MRHSRLLPFVLILLVVLFDLSPYSLTILLEINLLLLLLHGLMQWRAAYLAKMLGGRSSTATLQQQPFVSIHLPIHAEPPEVVCATIESILAQSYPNFELIVLDNNTQEKELWEPVQAYCKGRARVQFFHFEQVKHYKAGALNLCRLYTAASTEYVFTVDADYILTPHCLEKAVAAATSSQAALVQFPQAYSNITPQNRGLGMEYRHYFSLYAHSSNHQHTMLGTGTLSLIQLEALDTIGGWPTQTITEDAELGIQLQTRGYSTLFVDEELGRGQMPALVTGLRQQRLRWIFGNFQVLLLSLKKSSGKGQLLWACLPQLTAWINGCGLAFLLLFIACTHVWWVEDALLQLELVQNCMVLLGFYLVQKLVLFGCCMQHPKPTLSLFLTHLFYTAEAAFGWWDALAGLKKPFVRTNKFSGHINWLELPLGIPLLLGWCSVSLFYVGERSLAYWLAAGTLLWGGAVGYVLCQLLATKALSSKQQEQEPATLLYTQQ